jgi:hypothetical protein
MSISPYFKHLLRLRVNRSSLRHDCVLYSNTSWCAEGCSNNALDTTSSETYGGEASDIPCTEALAGALLRMHIDRLELGINMHDLDRHQPQPAPLIWAIRSQRTKGIKLSLLFPMHGVKRSCQYIPMVPYTVTRYELDGRGLIPGRSRNFSVRNNVHASAEISPAF